MVLPVCLVSNASTSIAAAFRSTFVAASIGFLFCRVESPVIFAAHRPFGNCHDAEIRSMPAAAANGFSNLAHIIRNFGNQNHISSRGNAGSEGQPARLVPHDFRHDDPMVAVGRAVKTVERFRGDPQGSVKTEGVISLRHVVINGLGQSEDPQTLFLEPHRVLLGAAAAQAYQRIEPVLAIILDDHRRHVMDFAVVPHPVWLVPAGAQDRAPTVRIPARVFLSSSQVRFSASPRTCPEADNVRFVIADCRLADTA